LADLACSAANKKSAIFVREYGAVLDDRLCFSALRAVRNRCFGLEIAEISDHAIPAFGFARNTGVAPVQNQPVMRIEFEFRWHKLQQFFFDDIHVLPGARPVRLETRKIWVSTAIIGSPNAVFITILPFYVPPQAGLPALRVISALRRHAVQQNLAGRDRILRLGFVQTNGLDMRHQPVSTQRQQAAGVFATGYSLRVALLTDTSVACADSNTAISNSNGVLYSSSVVGCGFCAWA
jgi:hypothetical protein